MRGDPVGREFLGFEGLEFLVVLSFSEIQRVVLELFPLPRGYQFLPFLKGLPSLPVETVSTLPHSVYSSL